MMPRLLLTEASAYPSAAIARLEREFEVIKLEITSATDLVDAARIHQPKVLIVGLAVEVSPQVIGASKELGMVVCAATGTDHIDTSELSRRNIRLVTLRERTHLLRDVSSTAELAWALLLALARGLVVAHHDVREGNWNRADHLGSQLRGKTLAVIGVGRLGSLVAGYGAAFGMEVLGVDPMKHSDPDRVLMVTQDEAFRLADAVSLHVPMSRDTRHLVNEELLNLSRPGLLLVNTSRGEIVDEHAVARAIVDGRLGGYGTDVIANDASWAGQVRSNEITPLIDRGYNVVATPHIGGYTREAIVETRTIIVDALLHEYQSLKTAQ